MAATPTTVDPLSEFISAAGVALSSSIVAQITLPLPQASSASSPLSSSPSPLSPSPSPSSLSSWLPTSSTLSSMASTPTSRTKPGSHTAHQKIAIAVVVPTVVVTLIFFALWAWRKSTRRNRRHPATSPEEIQPYLQQKAELEDEQRRKHELEARERVHELDGNEIFELRGRHSRQRTP